MAVDAFASLAADAIEAAQQTFETANVLEEEQGLDLSKLARPTSTWTYMVHDNPLADDSMSALSMPGIYALGFRMNRAPGERDRVVTVPNALSVLRLVLVPVFLYLLLVAHADGWAVAVLMFSGFSDWADGKIARLVDNQSSRLGSFSIPRSTGSTCSPFRSRSVSRASSRGGSSYPDRSRRPSGRDAAVVRSPRADGAAGDLHRQGCDLRAHVSDCR